MATKPIKSAVQSDITALCIYPTITHAHANFSSQDGCTALHMLCKSVMFGAEGRDSVARMMLEGGADPGAKDSQGNSSMDYASSESLRQLLRSSIASTSSGGAADEQPVRAPAQVVKAAASKKEKVGAEQILGV